MNLLWEALAWLFSPEQYQGEGSIPQRVAEHLLYTAGATAVAAVIAVPIGYFIGHTGRGGTWVVGITGAARALPSFGVILLLVLILGVSERVTASLVALVLLGIPPLMAGAYSGMQQIPRATIDAARAQGMTEWQIIRTVEIPLSLPLLLGGLRGAVLQIVATATLVAYVGLGGLGYDIIQGIPLRRFDQTVGTALVIVVVALALDGLLSALTTWVTPKGVQQGRLRDVRARDSVSRTAPVATEAASPEKKKTQQRKATL